MKPSRCKLSIIIPCYNAEQYIARCIESVLSEAELNAEVIVINDGSTDGTNEILNRYIDKISIINQQNCGVSTARNRGIEVASGDYIYFVDADDYIVGNELKKVLDKIDNQDVVSIAYSIDFYSSDNVLKSSEIRRSPYYEMGETKDVYHTLFSAQIGIGELDLQRWAKGGKLKDKKLQGFIVANLIKRSLIIENNIRFRTNIIYNEDAIFNTEVFEYAKTALFTDNVVYHYIKCGQGASYIIAKSPEKMARNKINLLKAKEEIYERELNNGVNILPLFCASNIFSIIEMSDLCARFPGGYATLKEYMQMKTVKSSLREMRLKNQHKFFKVILLIYKLHMCGFVFFTFKCANWFHIDFRKKTLDKLGKDNAE